MSNYAYTLPLVTDLGVMYEAQIQVNPEALHDLPSTPFNITGDIDNGAAAKEMARMTDHVARKEFQKLVDAEDFKKTQSSIPVERLPNYGDVVMRVLFMGKYRIENRILRVVVHGLDLHFNEVDDTSYNTVLEAARSAMVGIYGQEFYDDVMGDTMIVQFHIVRMGEVKVVNLEGMAEQPCRAAKLFDLLKELCLTRLNHGALPDGRSTLIGSGNTESSFSVTPYSYSNPVPEKEEVERVQGLKLDFSNEEPNACITMRFERVMGGNPSITRVVPGPWQLVPSKFAERVQFRDFDNNPTDIPYGVCIVLATAISAAARSISDFFNEE